MATKQEDTHEKESCQGSPKKRKCSPISKPPPPSPLWSSPLWSSKDPLWSSKDRDATTVLVKDQVATEERKVDKISATAETKLELTYAETEAAKERETLEGYKVTAQSLWDYHRELGSLDEDLVTREQWTKIVEKCLPIIASNWFPGLMPGETRRPIIPRDASDKSGWIGDCALVTIVDEDAQLREYLFKSDMKFQDLLVMAVYDDESYGMAENAVEKVAAKYGVKPHDPGTGYVPHPLRLEPDEPKMDPHDALQGRRSWAKSRDLQTRTDTTRIITGTCGLFRIFMYSWR